MTFTIEPAHEGHLSVVLGWLTKDQEGNRPAITNSFREGRGFCAMLRGSPVGFVIFQACAPHGDIHIIEVLPEYRRRKVGQQLMLAAEKCLRIAGAEYIDLTCTSPEGVDLGKALKYKDHRNPENPESMGPVPLRKALLGKPL